MEFGYLVSLLEQLRGNSLRGADDFDPGARPQTLRVKPGQDRS